MRGRQANVMIPGFLAIFILSTLAYILGNSQSAKAINLGYAFWALLIGLLISNTVGTPEWLKPAVRSEYYQDLRRQTPQTRFLVDIYVLKTMIYCLNQVYLGKS